MPENRSRCARVRDSRFRVRAPARAYKAAEPAVRGARAPHGVNMTPSTVYQKVFRAEDGLSYAVSRIYERWFEQLAKHAAACSRAHAVSVRTPYAPPSRSRASPSRAHGACPFAHHAPSDSSRAVVVSLAKWTHPSPMRSPSSRFSATRRVFHTFRGRYLHLTC